MNTRSRQRGAAALTVTLLLLFALALVLGYASRNLLFEQRSSANQVRSTQAFEAAETGLEWALAMLNSGVAVDADCAPSSAPGATTFRDRYLRYDDAGQRFSPRTWNDAGSAVPLHAACVLADSGWSCSCPSAGHPTLAAPPATGAHPAFALRFVGAPRSGMVQVVATGCDQLASACLPDSAGVSAGGTRAQVLLGLLPALATVPIAALTAHGDIAAEGALTLANADPGGSGLTAQAGGHVVLPRASLATVPGMPITTAVAASDEQLTGADAERLLTRLLGLDRARWQRLPDVRNLSCPADCTAELALAIGPETAHSMVWISGDLQLGGPATFGSAERPLLLVVEGQVRLSGDVQVYGVIISLAAAWDTSGSSDAQVRGAVVALGNVAGSGSPTITYDAGVLARLHGQLGTVARVPGSWRDF